MLNIFSIPLRLIKQIQVNPYFGAFLLASILSQVIIYILIEFLLGEYQLSLIHSEYVFQGLILWGLFNFITSYLIACLIDKIIAEHNTKKAFNSSCTAFIATLIYVYSVDPKMTIKFKGNVIHFSADTAKLSAMDQHKYKEYQILSKYLSSQLFYKAFPDFDKALLLQWRVQCKRFENNEGDLSAHWLHSVDELKKILLPHRTVILDISKNIEKYKLNKHKSELEIMNKIRQSFEQTQSK